jgi:hypothetical protein
VANVCIGNPYSLASVSIATRFSAARTTDKQQIRQSQSDHDVAVPVAANVTTATQLPDEIAIVQRQNFP